MCIHFAVFAGGGSAPVSRFYRNEFNYEFSKRHTDFN